MLFFLFFLLFERFIFSINEEYRNTANNPLLDTIIKIPCNIKNTYDTWLDFECDCGCGDCADFWGAVIGGIDNTAGPSILLRKKKKKKRNIREITINFQQTLVTIIIISQTHLSTKIKHFLEKYIQISFQLRSYDTRENVLFFSFVVFLPFLPFLFYNYTYQRSIDRSRWSKPRYGYGYTHSIRLNRFFFGYYCLFS